MAFADSPLRNPGAAFNGVLGSVTTTVTATKGAVAVAGKTAVIGEETVIDVGAPVLVDSKTAPANNSAFNCPADGEITWTYTEEKTANKYFAVRFRKASDTSFVQCQYGNSNGYLKLTYYSVDTWYDQHEESGLGTDGAPCTVDIVYSGTNIKVYWNASLKCDKTVDFNLTSVNGIVRTDLVTNDAELETYTLGSDVNNVSIGKLNPKVKLATKVITDKGSVTLSGLNPDIVTSEKTTVSCTKGAVAIAGFTTVVDAKTALSCSSGSITIVGYNPFVQINIVTLINVGGVSLVDSLSQPATGTLFDCNADGQIVCTHTYETGHYSWYQFRRASSESFLHVACADGSCYLSLYDDGFTDLDMAVGVFSNGVSYEITIDFVGSALSVAIDGVPTLSASSSYNSTVAQGRVQHDLVTNDIELSSYSLPTTSEVFITGFNTDVILAGPVTVSATTGQVSVVGYATAVGISDTYYVRADGSATKANALGPESSASDCMSLATMSASTFIPGDVVIVSGLGGIYRSQVTFKGGTASGRVTFEGSNSPVIDGTDIVTTWVNHAGNVWKKTSVSSEPRQIWIDGTYGDRKASIVACVNEFDWYWDDAADTIYLYAPGDPDTQYTIPGVEIPRSGDLATSQSYVTLDGITFKRSWKIGCTGWNASNVTIKNCIHEWNWSNGIGFGGDASWSNFLVEDVTARYNGCQGISVATVDPAIVTNLVIRRCTSYQNGRYQFKNPAWDDYGNYTGGIKVWGPARDSVIEDCRVYSNGPAAASGNGVNFGQGIWLDGVLCVVDHETQVRHNVVYDNHGVALYSELTSYSIWHNNLCYGNAKNETAGVWSNATIRNDSRDEGPAEANYNKYYNNTCYGGLHGILCLTTDAAAGVEVSHNEFKNNIIAGTAGAKVYADNGGDNDGTNGTGNVYAYNCFDAEANDFILWGGTAYDTYDAWETAYGGTTNSIEAAPALKDTGNDKYYLTSASPCIDVAADLGETFDNGLDPRILAAAWPDAVVTLDRDVWGRDLGAYVYDYVTAVGAVAAAGKNAVINEQTNVFCSGNVWPINVVGHATVVTVFEGVTVDCTLGTVVVLGRQPEVEVEREVLVAAAGAVTVTAFDAVITLPWIVLVASGAVTVAARQPEIVLNAKVFATKGALTISGFKSLIGLETAVLASTGVLLAKAVGAPTVWYTTKVSAARGAVSVAPHNAKVSIVKDAVPATLGTVTVAAVSPAFAMPDWYPKRIEAQSKPITILGKAASIIAPIIATALGTVAVTGYTAEIHQGLILASCSKGSVAVAGYSTLIGTKVSVSSKGAVTVVGYDAAGTISAIAKATKGALTVNGYPTIVNALAVWATRGDVLVVGHSPFVVAPFAPGFGVVVPTQTSKNYITYYQEWANHFPAEIARRWRQFLVDTFFIATPATVATGTGNSIQLTTDVEITEHTIGQAWRFIAAYTNTGGTILDVNGIGPQTVHYADEPLRGGEIVAGGSYEVVYDGNAWNLTSSSRTVVGSAGRVHMESQTIGHANAEALVWSDVPDYDDAEYFYPVGSDIEYILIPSSGRYRISGNIYVSTKGYGDGTLTRVYTSVYINEWSIGSIYNSSNTYECNVSFDYTAVLAAGDVVIIECYQQNSGSSSAAIVGDSTVPISPSWWSIERLR